MLQLDITKQDVEVQEFEYEVKGFGPKRGPAYIKVTARPASHENPIYAAAQEKNNADTKLANLVNERKHAQIHNDEIFLAKQQEIVDRHASKILEIVYDNSIIKWETNIQTGGKNLEGTRENYLALWDYGLSLDLAEVLMKISKDLANITNWQKDAEEEIEKEQIKNLKTA